MNGSARWARWNWSKGIGRGHRLFKDGDLTKTACQTPRKTASHAAVKTYVTKPADGAICPTCELFDALHEKFVATTDLVIDSPIIVSVPEAQPEPVLAEGLCICGCVKSDVWVAWKRDHDAWVTTEHIRHAAEFEAYVASKAVAA